MRVDHVEQREGVRAQLLPGGFGREQVGQRVAASLSVHRDLRTLMSERADLNSLPNGFLGSNE